MPCLGHLLALAQGEEREAAAAGTIAELKAAKAQVRHGLLFVLKIWPTLCAEDMAHSLC